MFRTTVISLFFLLNTFLTRAQNPGDSVFAGIKIFDINISFQQANYWDTLLYLYNLGTEEYISADVTIDGVLFPSTGVRFKGNSSFSHPNNKKSFRISFDEFTGSQRWDQLKGVHLNNCYGDPAFIREKLFLDLCRSAGIAAPRANYVRLSINDTAFAFYSLVEHVDKKFLSSRYGNSGGDLFKAVDGFDNNSLVSDFLWHTAAPDSYYNRYELKTDGSATAWPDLIGLTDTLNNLENYADLLSGIINLPGLYKAAAFNTLFANLDSYTGSGRNFYFYFNQATGKMEWIVWDTGLSFGGYSGGVSGPETMSLTYLGNQPQRPLLNKIFQNPALKYSWLMTLCDLNETIFDLPIITARIDSIVNIIRPYVYADPRKQYTNNQFEINIFSDLPVPGVGGGTRIPGIKSFLNLRKNNVGNQLNSLGISCNYNVIPGDIVINELMSSNPGFPDPAGEAEDWIELFNTTNKSVNLGGKFLWTAQTGMGIWQFPEGSIIPANGFLIIWADNDLTQQGIHAGFSLGNNGGTLYLSDTDSTLLDSALYTPLPDGVSLGRFPDGAGSFIQMTPTPGAVNQITDLNDPDLIPGVFSLRQNFPNPFNPQTTIRFTLPEGNHTELKVFSSAGDELMELVNKYLNAGTHEYIFKTSDLKLASGVYFCRLKSGRQTSVISMIFIK